MDLRIGTWNLDHARAPKHDGARLQVLAEADADVIVLTETNDRVAPPGYSPVHSLPRPNAAEGGRWVSIWSRLPIVRRVDVENPNRSAAAMLKRDTDSILVYGMVLPWHADFGEPPIEPRPRAWQEQYRVLRGLPAEWERVQRECPGSPLYVAGDLNLSLGGPRYYGTREGRQLLETALRACQLRCATSFENVPPGVLSHPAIDHVLVPKVVGSDVVMAWEGRRNGVTLSDHSGLVVKVDVGIHEHRKLPPTR